MAQGESTRLAVLIDADNALASVAKELLEEVAKFGAATVKQAYADWTTPNLVGSKAGLHRQAVQLHALSIEDRGLTSLLPHSQKVLVPARTPDRLAKVMALTAACGLICRRHAFATCGKLGEVFRQSRADCSRRSG